MFAAAGMALADSFVVAYVGALDVDAHDCVQFRARACQ